MDGWWRGPVCFYSGGGLHQLLHSALSWYIEVDARHGCRILTGFNCQCWPINVGKIEILAYPEFAFAVLLPEPCQFILYCLGMFGGGFIWRSVEGRNYDWFGSVYPEFHTDEFWLPVGSHWSTYQVIFNRYKISTVRVSSVSPENSVVVWQNLWWVYTRVQPGFRTNNYVRFSALN